MQNMYREQLDAWIDGKRDEMLADLSTLVKIDSTRGTAEEGKPFGAGPAAALREMAGLMEAYGLRVTDYDNYVVTGDFGEGEKELDILAHLDVVPVTEDWTVTKPFEPRIVGDRIYGRGTSDDKGPAIAALYAVRAVKEAGISLKRSVRLIFGSDEECGSSDLEHYYAVEQEAPCTFTPDADFPLINLEKARLDQAFFLDLPDRAAADGKSALLSLQAGDKVNVVPGKARAVIRLSAAAAPALEDACRRAEAETGAAFTVTGPQTETGAAAGGTGPEETSVFDILAKGTAAHASTPEEGNNAATAMLVLLRILCEATDLKEDAAAQALTGLLHVFPHGDTTGKAGGIEMSDEVSGALTQNLGILTCADGKIRGEVDMRAPLCASDDNVTEVFRQAMAREGYETDGARMKKAHYVPADSPFVRTLLDSYRDYFGQEGEPIYTGGGTYVHELERGVAFGCAVEGVDNHMHGDDEFMEIDILVRSAKIFADVIVKLCG